MVRYWFGRRDRSSDLHWRRRRSCGKQHYPDVRVGPSDLRGMGPPSAWGGGSSQSDRVLRSRYLPTRAGGTVGREVYRPDVLGHAGPASRRVSSEGLSVARSDKGPFAGWFWQCDARRSPEERRAVWSL